jgi:uncharacterized protein YerC
MEPQPKSWMARLSANYGVSKSQVSRIKRKLNWGHLHGH